MDVTVSFDLSHARATSAAGFLISCATFFRFVHDIQRLLIELAKAGTQPVQ
jgi:hypothetical protein